MTAQSQNKPTQNHLLLGEVVGAAPAKLPQPVTLQGRFGRVEKLDTKLHGASLWRKLANDSRVWAYIPYGPFENKNEFIALLDEALLQNDPYFYAILNINGDCVGYSALMEMRPAMGVIEVGYVVYAKSLQQTPLGTEAQYLLMRYAFEELGYRRYEWKCNALNAASRRAALRYGFIFEGVFRQHMIIKGRNRDTAWFSILDKEWPKIKQRFETWLAPDNFDENGRQKTALNSE